jgi:ribonuclease R
VIDHFSVIVGMPLPKNDRSQRPARGKTIQAKTRGKSLDKSKSDDNLRRAFFFTLLSL